MSTVSSPAEPVPLEVAVEVFESAVAGLVAAAAGDELVGLPGSEQVEVWQRVASACNRLAGVDHALVHAAQTTGLAEEYGFGSLGMFLTRMLRLSPGDAAARIRAAAAVGPRTSMLGERLEPVMPVLAAAQAAGEVSAEQVGIVERAVTELTRPDLDRDTAPAAERLLTEHALIFGPKQLRLLARRVIDAADPDGRAPDDRIVEDRRFLELRPLRDGMWRLEGRLSPTVGLQLDAILTPLARPRTTRTVIDGTPIEEPDPRPYPQRLHDGLDEACGRLLKGGDLPATGGVPATVILTVTADDLLRRTGHAETSDGALLSPGQLLRLAGEAEIWPMITTSSGVPLALGRTRRIASHAQTIALVARDGGCVFPGCTHPPSHCDRHHIIEWVDGGPTDLTNLTLLCRYHHTHFARNGWTVQINTDGLPAWTPPTWVDRQQRPQINDRILRRQRQLQLVA